MKFHNSTFVTLFFSFFIISIFSCEEKFEIRPFYDDDDESISEYIRANEDTFANFRALLKKGDLERTLTAYNPHGNNYTLFLPANEAFDRFISDSEKYGSFEELINDQDYVNSLVRYHVVNMALKTNDFPYGRLPDTTLSGDHLTIAFSGDIESIVQKVNDYASIVQPDIELSNGYIHVIDEVLKPVVFTSYEWLDQNSEYSVFARALEVTGLMDTFNIKSGEKEHPSITLLIESDEVFSEKGIYSIDDLIDKYSSESQNFTEDSNGLYQFVAYHMMTGMRFLNDFEGISSNYNTYGRYPISINGKGLDFKINSGVEIFDTIIVGYDTTIIDFIELDFESCNVMTKNGAIHFIKNVMELYRPQSISRWFEFYENPVIKAASKMPFTYLFDDPNEFPYLDWQGVEEITYYKSSSYWGWSHNDYLMIDGDFSISYEIPKILPGNYLLKLRVHSNDSRNAIIQVFFDEKIVGGNLDLTSRPGSGSSIYNYVIGQVVLDNYERHEIKIQSLISGRLIWDYAYLSTDID